MKYNLITLLIGTIALVSIFGFHRCSCEMVQFIFGDSLSDVGNNNYLSKGFAKANVPWYGIDFGNGLPNGRFCNGRTVADIIGDTMGLPRPVAFMDPSINEDTIMQNGVNFASGGGGILNETALYFVQRFCFYKQIKLFQAVQELIREKMGTEASQKFFQESLYVVALGSNDFINNFLMPVESDSWTYTDDTFMTYLVQTLQDQITLLHGLGARKVLVFGLGPMGCIPLQRALSTTGGCQDRPNKLSLRFNQATQQMMADLSSRLPNASFQFGDAYDVVDDLIKNPSKYGFTNSDSPCCNFGKIRPALTCIPMSKLCKDRSKYVFWDEYHPSESANQLIANEIVKKMGISGSNISEATSVPPRG